MNISLITGIILLIAGLWLAAKAFGLYYPSFKTDEEREAYEERMYSRGTWLKILSIIMILKGCYNLYQLRANQMKAVKEKSEWGIFDDMAIADNCMASIPDSIRLRNPKAVYKYCKCAAEQIKYSLKKDQYMKLMSGSEEDRKTIKYMSLRCQEYLTDTLGKRDTVLIKAIGGRP